MFKIGTIKRTVVHIRYWTKFAVIAILAALLIIGAIACVYKPIYSVSLDGELIGYTENKNKLQQKINEYIEAGNEQNIAFVEINELPEYNFCFLKKEVETNDDEIYDRIISQGTNYYKYYAISVDNEEKKYVSTFDEAQEVIDQLKEKDSNNKDDLTVVEKYEKQLEEFSDVETCVADLYEKKIQVVSSYVVAATGVNSSNQKVELGISLISPVSGTVTSRFGSRWGRTHKGIDIGASYAAPIKAVASGTVTTSSYGYNGGYGNYVIISHGNGVQTVYAHCSSLNVDVGEYVSQGEVIAAVGSTGSSTGNHLHLEIRVNGIAQNPQNYLY